MNEDELHLLICEFTSQFSVEVLNVGVKCPVKF